MKDTMLPRRFWRKGAKSVKLYIFSEERCVACGRQIPEGRMVCPICCAEAEEAFVNRAAFHRRHSKKRKTAFMQSWGNFSLS